MRKVTQDEDTGRGRVMGAMNNFTAADKKYQCTSCEYATNFTTVFKRHLRTHSGEKPFHCPYCPVRCTRKATLITHIQWHTGETPIVCAYCPYATRDKSNLNKHMKRYHKHLQYKSGGPGRG